MHRVVNIKTDLEIAQEWDLLAEVRFHQISDGIDITYRRFLIPIIMNMIPPDAESILDVGCGVGYLSNEIANSGKKVTGVDASEKNISLAKSNFGSEIDFYNDTLEQFSKKNPKKYDAIIANMVLMDVIHLDDFLHSCRSLLNEGGYFIFSLTHPYFWPKYYGYYFKSWFNYNNCYIIESPFRITGNSNLDFISTHIHRPISVYLNSLRNSRFLLNEIKEPMPNSEILALYPRPWEGPRYLFGLCTPF